jgi:hypothetical protein
VPSERGVPPVGLCGTSHPVGVRLASHYILLLGLRAVGMLLYYFLILDLLNYFLILDLLKSTFY